MKPFEKLGAFYLGRRYDSETAAVTRESMLYDAKDLTTHAVIVGMTGSGKTGLGISLLEEAAIDNIPSLIIDPKGDMGNLLLTFPSLRPADFLPWIDRSRALAQGTTPQDQARRTAELWRSGLKEWEQGGERIKRLRQAANFRLYTPGSEAGRPLALIRSFAAPNAGILEDGDALRERISSAVSGLLALLGLNPNPIRSREHVLLSCIFGEAWKRGSGLDLPELIRSILTPPFERIGIMDLETVFPADDRHALAMRLNNMLASPDFAAWGKGEALDVGRLLWDEHGKPNVCVLSIAHLDDAQRMFFVTTLLGEVVAYMRGLSGSSGLRALVYMDEVFGYLPPTANPPSKIPMLTLLKQARAFGIGLVLSTQNPVDLDYKALSNAGTWFLGRLQTERDKARVLDGLEGASVASGQGFNRKAMDSMLSGLGQRVFLMNNVHEDEPTLFQTRWAMSYLAGPLATPQIRQLSATQGATIKNAETKSARAANIPESAARRSAATTTDKPGADRPPVIDPTIHQGFVPPTIYASGDAMLLYRPALVAEIELHHANARLGVDHWSRCRCLAAIGKRITGNVWTSASFADDLDLPMADEPESGASFAPLAGPAKRAKSYTAWKRSLKTFVYKERPLIIRKCSALKLASEVGETEAEFMVRLRETARERRDLEMEKLRKRYAPKLARLRDRIHRQEQRIEREQSQVSQQKMQTVVSLGSTMLGALFGRKIASVGSVRRAATTMRSAGRVTREKQDVARARDTLERLAEQLAELEADFQDALAEREADFAVDSLEIKEVLVRPRKTEITVSALTLVWIPWWRESDGENTPAHPAAETIDA